MSTAQTDLGLRYRTFSSNTSINKLPTFSELTQVFQWLNVYMVR